MDHKLNHILDANPLDVLISTVDNQCENIISRSYLNAYSASESKSASIDELRTGLEAQASALEATLSQLIFRIRKTAHSLALLHYLPDEILLMIFRELTMEDRPVAAALRLSCVCSKWRALLLSNPSFWTQITISDATRPEFVSLSLERSKGTPLVISYCESGYKELTSILMHASEIMAVLRPAIRQVRNLSFAMKPDYFHHIITSLTNIDAPALESLSILAKPSCNWRVPENLSEIGTALTGPLFSDNTPRLVCLKVDGFHISWNSQLYDNLIHLSITIPITELIQFFAALRHSPQLETLHVLWLPYSNGVVQAEDLNRVVLPHLTELELYDLPFLKFRSMIRHISIPAVKYVQLRTSIATKRLLSLADICYCLPSEILACLRSTQHLKLSTTPHEQGIMCWPTVHESDKHSSLSLTGFGYPRPTTTFHSIITFFPHVTILSLTDPHCTLPPILNGYKNIEELRIYSINAYIRRALDADGCLSSVRILHASQLLTGGSRQELSALATPRSNIRVLRFTRCRLGAVTPNLVARFRNVGITVDWDQEATIMDRIHGGNQRDDELYEFSD